MTTATRLALAPLALFLTMPAQAVADAPHAGPHFSGTLSGGVLDVDDRDSDLWAFKAEAGVDGLYRVNDDLRIRYELVGDFANAINSVDAQTWTPGAHAQEEGEIYVRTARVFLLTDYGSLGLQPRAPSGFWGQIYRNIDTFEYNRLHKQTGQNAIFGQSEQGTDVLSYGSPKFHGFRFIAAALTPDNHNGEELDVVTGRLVYDQGPLNAGIGHTRIDTPAGDGYDLTRTSFGLGYDFGMIRLGGVYEHNDDRADSTNRGFDAWGVNASARFTDAWSASLGYAENDNPGDADNSNVTGIVRHHFNDRVYAFLEAASYQNSDDNLATGISVSF
ncbi:porin [Halomonas sp. HG01]|uniref:porin n=1 Tax=Halomonas sp. HG01 TaxID=1609967 RepID=UPI000614891A|nr:porin [Halomonas sp. HG01]